MCGIAQTIQQSKKIPRASGARGLSSVIEAPCGVEPPPPTTTPTKHKGTTITCAQGSYATKGSSYDPSFGSQNKFKTRG
jgi:hypothetical protein